MKLPARRGDLRYALWRGALLLTALTPLFAGHSTAAWELAQWSGLLGCLALLVLCGAPLRPRNSTPATLLSLKSHTLLGWIALAAVVLHAGGLILADHLALEYWRLSAPWYQWAGVLAALLMLLVSSSGLPGWRSRLWEGHRSFQATHVTSGVLILGLTAAHVVATGRYAGGTGRRLLYVSVTVGSVLMLLRSRRRSSTARDPASQVRSVFGRHAAVVVGAAVTMALALLILGVNGAAARLREPVLQRTHGLPLDFPHGKHTQVNCLVCHHNFADGKGFENCVGCHKGTRTDLKMSVEPRFHGFCFECHRHPTQAFEGHGPVDGCATCHHSPAGAP